ncbi:MAG: 3-deoxy-manno-octulosonate cytidylyltransferase [Proteobacteria bacterium]|nr:3-deoxy-manno-octulosonate cytidylyltransferase [Pseudomonadota bacterium]
MRTIGVVPARMASSRFPGKPLAEICGRPMIGHVFERAKLFGNWDALVLATCDPEIAEFGEKNRYPVIMTSDTHTRALERVAEAAENCGLGIADEDLVVCVQGDEPMMRPDMIDVVLAPLLEDRAVEGTVLAMEITDDALFRNPDTVKIVHDTAGDVLYTSRAPVPYCQELSPGIGARRIYGILAFRWSFLHWFNSQPESPLEILEACDSNRICDNGRRQRIAPYPSIPSYSVDSPADLAKVDAYMKNDPFWGKY